MLLLNKPLRLSTDIDIIVSPGYDMEKYVKKASRDYPFLRYEESKRKGVNSIAKQHFRFYYKSLKDETKEIPILLDVVYEYNHYAKVDLREIKNELVIVTGNPIFVKIPSVESLLGDKLTAFAPHTIGIRPIIEKNDNIVIDKRTEVVKQFFDVASLFDVAENQDDIETSYRKTAEAELRYRGLDISVDDCLVDTFNSALAIFSKGRINNDIYQELLFGIQTLGSFLINEKFNGETAYRQAAKVMYLSSCLLTHTKIQADIPEFLNIAGEYSMINFMRKIDKEYFSLAAYATQIFASSKK